VEVGVEAGNFHTVVVWGHKAHEEVLFVASNDAEATHVRLLARAEAELKRSLITAGLDPAQSQQLSVCVEEVK
jgi:hypothetical protein